MFQTRTRGFALYACFRGDFIRVYSWSERHYLFVPVGGEDASATGAFERVTETAKAAEEVYELGGLFIRTPALTALYQDMGNTLGARHG